ncbi:discoidin domain-containing protein [Cohnella zeiphila]|uniref:Discoidin domain-containing protein n=1 Tax=Cohnella zeiphila TaxID=2761120 RepID=A0A7X0SII1_9BACL|nr:discoidin domain-containing protein [Cohnella zeiphila]MBB6730592.1 discoidin domain-containing protein [Cohnella zeiphila]
MGKRGRIAATLFAAALLIAVACWTAFGRGWGGGKAAHAEAAAAYGAWIADVRAQTVAGEELEGGSAGHAVDGSGMSGAEAKSQTHGNGPGTAWAVRTKDGERASIVFDLGSVQPLGEMWIWNGNEPDSDSPEGGGPGRGLKDVSIELSADGEAWTEWQGDGYPFRFARADGSDRLAATNLDDGRQSPVRFGGASARYVRLTAAEAPGKGNWMANGQGERVFGLSEVRFYRYAREVVYGGAIDPIGATDSGGDAAVSHPENAVNGYGMTEPLGREDGIGGLHDNDARAMWLLRADPTAESWLTVDLGGTYPLDEMRVWNYDGAGSDGQSQTDRGLRDVAIYYSLDGKAWTELKGRGYPYRLARADGSKRLAATNRDGGQGAIAFGGASARYVKLVPRGGAGQGNWGAEDGGQTLYGLSELTFTCGSGVAAEPAPEWTGLFSGYEGWTGADGIFSIPLDGMDRPGSATGSSKTLFLFGDTFVGHVNPVSKTRETGAIVRNSVALLGGAKPDPGALRFDWAPKTADLSLFSPHTPNAAKEPGSWYWLQDGVARSGKLTLFPLLMAADPSQPPGFQFAIRGVARIEVPIGADGPDYAAQTQVDAPLYKKLPDGGEMAFGAGILDNTAEAGAPFPDGYLYTYGYKTETTGVKRLLVARVQGDRFDDFASWRFWDGRDWSERIEDAAPLLDGVSPELSVTPMQDGRWNGKYLLVCEKDSVGGTVAYSVGDSPAGPFEPLVPLYHTPESDGGEGVMTYNAKAHPHLSANGDLLVTYNVNSTSQTANMADADIYRPRWIRVREIAPSGEGK